MRNGAEVLEEIEKNIIDVLSNKTKKPCLLITDRREKWAEDEAKLAEKREFDIDISNTTLGREKARLERDLDIAATDMSQKDRDALIEKLNAQNKQDDTVQAVAMVVPFRAF